MCDQWIGCTISIDCGETLGYFQGQVSAVNVENQTVSLKRAYRNGIQCQVPEITISAPDIQHLSLLDSIDEPSSQPEPSTSKISYTKPAKRSARTVSESVASDYSSYLRDSPRKIVEEGRTRAASVSEPENRTPSKKERQRQKCVEKDEICFGCPIDDSILQEDFDFEKNLALFNKQAVFEEIDAAQKPDVIRLVDCNRRQKFRNDENILQTAPAVYRQILIPEADTKEYVTDAGLVVPSISVELRQRLMAAAEKHGLSTERQAEIMGRGATEMVIQLLGGSHRLNPHNSHQFPTVVLLCGPHQQGSVAINCARHLAGHGVITVLYIPDVCMTHYLAEEISLYKMTGQKFTTEVKDLPTSAVDMVITALDDHEIAYQLRVQPWYRSAALWANECRAPVLALDPPANGTLIDTKFSLVPALPLAHEPENGKIYLCNLSIPVKVFEEVGIIYSTPFGPKFVIPLHLNDT